jgi:hypothetical protein
MSEDTNSKLNSDLSIESVPSLEKKKNPKVFILIIASIFFAIVSIVNFSSGFDKMNNYLNDSRFPSLSINAYVGGDAYNYIINSNYFTGYMIIATGALICSTICAITALNLSSQKA